MAKKGHHGGAWKVAYADFVTALMSLFMVLWIIGQDQDFLKSTAEYFNDPSAFSHNIFIGQEKLRGEGSEGEDGTGVSKIAREQLNKLAESIYNNLHIGKDDKKKPIDIFITPDGLRILIYNLPDKRLFADDLVSLTAWGDLIVQSLAWILDQHLALMKIVVYDPNIRQSKLLEQAQSALRKQGDTPQTFAWDLNLQRGQIFYRQLVYHGFSLQKISEIKTDDQLPKEASHKLEAVELSLHLDRETIRSLK